MEKSKRITRRVWRGTLRQDLRSVGDLVVGKEYTLKKGQSVIVKRKRIYENGINYRGEFEFHYTNLEGMDLVRVGELLLNEFERLSANSSMFK